jgi:hypothetical protein
MKLDQVVSNRIIKKLIQGQDYRAEVVSLIDATFMSQAVSFLREIVKAKVESKKEDLSWFVSHFLNDSLPSNQIATNSGLNMKTISNMYNSGSRSTVIKAAYEHFEVVSSSIKDLIAIEEDVDVKFKITIAEESVDLNLHEYFIILNALAVKRAALRGGAWSTAGKTVEKPLMQTLCKLYRVPNINYSAQSTELGNNPDEYEREIDFYLVSSDSQHKCEVKLMGKGNPESADAVIARSSKVFVADKLSDSNKRQLDKLKVLWVELRGEGGYLKFGSVLSELNIPHTAPAFDSKTTLDSKLESYLFADLE